MSTAPILVVVESPAKAKTIRKILGDNYTVRPTVGHIIDLEKGKNGNIGVDIEDGFRPRYTVIHDKRDKVAAIKSSALSASKIYIAADPDREGEAIAFHVLSQLKDIDKPIERVEFHEITPAGIKRGIANIRPFNKELYDAQQARRVLDRIVGFMVSPYLGNKIQKGLSAGRVQSVALKLIVDREVEIEEFKPETYFNISATLKKDSKKIVAKYRRITNESLAKKVTEDLNKSTYKVSDVKSQQKSKQALSPLTTSLLQQLASSHFKMNVDAAMKAAQGLYENGHVTYIRSDSLRSSKESIDALRQYLVNNGHDVPDSANVFKNKDASQDAHEAIRPTNIDIESDNLPVINEDQKKIYRLIWTRFAASQMKPALYDTIHVKVSTDTGHDLSIEGKTLADPGWLTVGQAFVKKEKDVLLPILKVNDKLDFVSVKNEEKQTLPLPKFNQGTLVKELERRSIGRPSTYASIIKRISSRNYVKSTAKGFEATELGRKVSDDLKKYFSFMSYHYTANMESQLDLIAEGKLGYEEMLSKFFESFKREYKKARASMNKSAGMPCPICKEDMVIRHGIYGFFAGCVSYPDCKGIQSVKIENDKVIPITREVESGVFCPLCKEPMIRRDGRFGPFYACSKNKTCKGKRKVPFGKKCPKCKVGELYINLMNEEAKLCCMKYPDCKHIEDIPDGVTVDWAPPRKQAPHPMSNKVNKVMKARNE